MKLSETAAKLVRERVYSVLKDYIVTPTEAQFKEHWEAIVPALMQLDFMPIPPDQSELGILKFKKE